MRISDWSSDVCSSDLCDNVIACVEVIELDLIVQAGWQPSRQSGGVAVSPIITIGAIWSRQGRQCICPLSVGRVSGKKCHLFEVGLLQTTFGSGCLQIGRAHV